MSHDPGRSRRDLPWRRLEAGANSFGPYRYVSEGPVRTCARAVRFGTEPARRRPSCRWPAPGGAHCHL